MKWMVSTLLRGSVFIAWSVVVLYVVSLLTFRLIGFHTTIVMSDSMSPLLQVGDVVVLKQKHHYQVGDVVQFSRGGLYYIHRIVKTSKTGFQTQGDANPIPDKVTIQTSDIQGEAIGVLRRYGDPLYQFRRFVGNFSHAAFSTQIVSSSVAHSSYWQNPIMPWSVISGSQSINFTAPNGVTFLNSGTRTIQASSTNGSLVKIYLDGRQTQKDPISGGFYFSTHTCLNTFSRPTCGWVIQFEDTAKVVKLFTYQSNGSFGPLLASKQYSTLLSQNRKFVLEVSHARLLVKLENEILLDLSNPHLIASTNNSQIPSGTRTLMYMTGENRFNANKLIIW